MSQAVLNLDTLYGALTKLDNGAFNGISYALTGNNTLIAPWWVTIPFGSWPVATPPPNPSPLETSIFAAFAAGGTDACFIDIMDLGDASSQFMDDPSASMQIVNSIIACMNAVPLSTKCIVRFVQGNSGSTAPDPQSSGFVNSLWSAAGGLRPGANALFCFGNFAPSIDSADTSLPQEWTALLTSLLNYVKSGLPSWAQGVFTALEPYIVSWCESYLKLAAEPVTWNHAKIFAVNGRLLVTGGANYWGDYSTGSTGPFDMSMLIRGDAALASHKYSDYVWGYLNNIPPNDQSSCGQVAQLTVPGMNFATGPAPMFNVVPSNQGSLRALMVGKNGNCGTPPQDFPVQIVDGLRDFILNVMGAIESGDTGGLSATIATAGLLSDDNPGFRRALLNAGVNPAGWATRYARNVAIANSKSVLRLSQQKLAMDDLYLSSSGFRDIVTDINAVTGCGWDGLIWPFDLFMAFAKAFAAMSANSNAAGLQLACSYYDPGHESYQDSITRAQFVARLTQVMTAMKASGQIAPVGDIATLINRLLVYKRLDYLKRQPNTSHGNHSKMVIADDAICFIGSDNAYPSYNQEIGLWIEDSTSIAALLAQYWTPMWQYAVLATTTEAGASESPSRG